MFEPNYESFLKHYACPDWFRDAKFGIFLHWGINSVPGHNGHYARFMYLQEEPADKEGRGWADWGKDVYRHHCDTYGHPSKFGYKDFLDLWKAEKFDAVELGTFFKDIGARYVVPVAVHCDNFDNWDSAHQRYNSVNMGPRRDIIGEWKHACKKLDLRFGVSTHMNDGHDHVFFQGETDTTGPLAGVPYDTVDPAFEDLYGRRTPDRKRLRPEFGAEYEARHFDLLDKYHPDLLYFDGKLPYGEHGMNVAARFFNQNREDHDGRLEAVLNLKHGFPEGAAVHDIERGQSSELRDLPWQTDTTINTGWFYLGEGVHETTAHGSEAAMDVGEGGMILSGGMCVQNLCDIVSKNGNLLLNVGQRADGSLPERLRRELEIIGRWLSTNGEAIYQTRPWKIYGEGPTQVGDGFSSEPTTPFTTDDIRFTTRDGVMYVIVLGALKDKISVRSLGMDAPQQPGRISRITMLGSEAPVSWEQTKSSLDISPPKELPSEHACVFRIEGAITK
jgi:alpha-L-fucosidase